MNTTTNTSTTDIQICERCGGSGVTVFRHIEGGRCYRCHGTGRAAPARRPAAKPMTPGKYENFETTYVFEGSELLIQVSRRIYDDGHAGGWSGYATWNGERAEIITTFDGERRAVATEDNGNVVAALRSIFRGIVIYQF